MATTKKSSPLPSGWVSPDFSSSAKTTAPDPAVLAAADRILTPTEQAIVDRYQEAQANAMGEAEEKKGGPRAVAVNVTPQGALIKASSSEPFPWNLAFLGVGVAAIAYLLYERRK
jgi:L-aminopeptidase/D-esterase-like protein